MRFQGNQSKCQKMEIRPDSDSDWNAMQSLIKRYYVTDQNSLRQVAAIMRNQHRFNATQVLLSIVWILPANLEYRAKQYKRMFRIWQWGKYRKRRGTRAASVLTCRSQNPRLAPLSGTVKALQCERRREMEVMRSKCIDPRLIEQPALFPELRSNCLILGKSVLELIRSWQGFRNQDDAFHSTAYRELDHRYETKLRCGVLNSQALGSQGDATGQKSIFRQSLTEIRPLLENFDPLESVGILTIFSKVESRDAALALIHEFNLNLDSVHRQYRAALSAFFNSLRSLLASCDMSGFQGELRCIQGHCQDQLTCILGPRSLIAMYLIALTGLPTVRDMPVCDLLHEIRSDFNQTISDMRLDLDIRYFMVGYYDSAIGQIHDTTLKACEEMLKRAKIFGESCKAEDMDWAHYYLSRAYYFLAKCHHERCGGDVANMRHSYARALMNEAMKHQIENKFEGLKNPCTINRLTRWKMWCIEASDTTTAQKIKDLLKEAKRP
jgi:hypothetical protein